MTTNKTPLYIPFSDVCRTLFINIPDAMREATYRALTRLEREVGDVDAYVAAKLNYCHTQCGEDEFKEGLRTLCSAFANEQVDALALAIRNYEERDGKGVIIADQTGVGKGRSLGGMIKYAHLNGMIPVFITKHPTLFTDIYRDLYDIGMDDFVVYKYLTEQTEFNEGDEIADDEDEQVEGIDEEDVPDTDTLYDLKETFKLNSNYDKEARNKKTFVPFIINGKSQKTHIRDFEGNIIYEGLPNTSSEFRNIISNTSLPDPYNVILCTYSQFGRLSKKMDYLKSIAHKAFFILDESHTASGDSRVGKYLRELTSLAKGTVFSSATFAKRPDNFLLYINKTSLIDANMRQDAMVGAIQKGGVALQEVISSQLTEEGYLIRRERTYDENTQVNYIYLDETQEAVQEKTITHPEWNKKDEHWQKYDNIIHYLFKIIKFQEEYVMPAVEALSQSIVNRYGEMGALGAKELKRTAKLGAFTNPLFSQLFNFTYQLFFSLKADIVADVAIAHLKAGRKPIIAFKSTLESMLNYLVNDEGEKVKIGDKIRDDYSVILEKLLFSTLRYREEHPDGTIIKFFNPEDIGGDFAIVFKAIHNEIKKMKFGIPSSPIDYILNKIRKAGYTHVEEITARTRKLIPSEKEGFVRIAPRKPIPVANISRQFQNNEIDCLLINQSGATGISLHATREKTTLKTDNEVKQRAMIIMQAELDINVEVQKRGRISRTGQILYPIYEYVISSIPAEQRLMMMLQRKLKSLDANTSSNQTQSKAMLEFPDFLNKYGDIIVADWLKKHPRENQITGDLIKSEEGKEEIPHDLAYRVSGRMALTDCTTQQIFFDDVFKAYMNYIEELKRKDEFDLEVEFQAFDAELKEKDVSIIGTGVEGYFGGNTYLCTYLVNNLRKPFKFEEVKEMVTQSLGDNEPNDIVQKLITDYKRYNDHRREEDENYYKEKFEKERKELQKLPLTEERKKEKLDKVKETEAETMIRIAERYELNRTMKRHLEYFTVGKVIAYPAFDYLETNNINHGVIISVSPSHNEKNPYAPSNIHLKLAVNTTDRNINIPFSQSEVLESIIDATSYKDFDDLTMENIEEDWDSESKAMQKDRIQRHIITGNLLQAYSKAGKTGRLVRFTLKKGSEDKGVLLPISYDPMSGGDEDKDRVKVPARMALHFIKALSMGTLIGTDAGMTIERSYGLYRIAIPARKEFKDIYTNPRLTELINGKEFIQSGRTMFGKMEEKKLPELINFMADARMNVMVSRTLYDIVKEQHPELGKETIQDVQAIEVDYAQKGFYEKLYVLKTMLEKGKAINQSVSPKVLAQTSLKKDIDPEKFLKEHILVGRLEKHKFNPQTPSYKLITDNIKNFFPKNQLKVIADNLRGEEKEHFKDILIEFDKRISEMPVSYETDDIPTKDKIVWLHYFTGNSDWYIVEKDKGSAVNVVKGKQHQAYGYADMGQGEWGYISIEEMLGSRVELDLYFEPVKFSEIEKKMRMGGGVSDLEKELHKLQRDLNNSRLQTYRESDNSEEEMARQRERAGKIARFNEVLLQLLREKDSKYFSGGSMAIGGGILNNAHESETKDGVKIIESYWADKKEEKYSENEFKKYIEKNEIKNVWIGYTKIDYFNFSLDNDRMIMRYALRKNAALKYYVNFLNHSVALKFNNAVFLQDANYEDYENKILTKKTLDILNTKLSSGGSLATGGGVENLAKELHKLQRDLNSNRLLTYRVGDNSEEEMARQKERAVKIVRFNEVLQLLREKDSKYADGGNIDIEAIKLKFAKEDIATLEKEGAMAIYDTKHGVLWGKYSKGIYSFDNQKGKRFNGNKDEATNFIKNAYQTEFNDGGKITPQFDDNNIADKESVMDVFNNWVKSFFDKQGYFLQYNKQDKNYIYVTAFNKLFHPNDERYKAESRNFLIPKKRLFVTPPRNVGKEIFYEEIIKMAKGGQILETVRKVGKTPSGADLRFNNHDEPYLLVNSEDAEAVKWAEETKLRIPEILYIGKYVKGGKIPPQKALQILHDGTAHGKPLTEKQRKYFGARASGEPVKSWK